MSLNPCRPRSRRVTPTGRSSPASPLAVSDSSTCPPCAAAPTRAAPCTPMPTYPCPLVFGSPLCSPIHTRTPTCSGHSCAANSRWASVAAETASRAEPEPQNRVPLRVHHPASVRGDRSANNLVCSTSTLSSCHGQAASAAWLDPSMSVNRKVTVPLGSRPRGTGRLYHAPLRRPSLPIAGAVPGLESQAPCRLHGVGVIRCST